MKDLHLNGVTEHNYGKEVRLMQEPVTGAFCIMATTESGDTVWIDAVELLTWFQNHSPAMLGPDPQTEN